MADGRHSQGFHVILNEACVVIDFFLLAWLVFLFLGLV